MSLHGDHVREIRAPLLTLFAGVAILLVIACVNVAALLVARAASRSRETALRMALGAGRIRLLRQCLVEGLLLTGLGGLAGVVVGQVGLKVLLALRPHGLDSIATARIDLAVLIFAAGIALAWGLLCALSPLAEIWRTDLTIMLAQDGRTTHGSSRSQLRVGLVIVQLAFSVVLLVSASLLVRTFINLQRVAPDRLQETGRYRAMVRMGRLRFVATPLGEIRTAPVREVVVREGDLIAPTAVTPGSARRSDSSVRANAFAMSGPLD